ncbi:MAG: hypothetical protein FWD11_02055, partial [Micrococcales bacterium]|nr:hypothetical protein [Micrococcales bacterium]
SFMYHVVVQYYERPRKERTPFVRSALNKGTSDRHTKDHNETRVITKPVQGGEHKVDEIKGTRDRHTKGRNDADYRRRVHRI